MWAAVKKTTFGTAWFPRCLSCCPLGPFSARVSSRGTVTARAKELAANPLPSIPLPSCPLPNILCSCCPPRAFHSPGSSTSQPTNQPTSQPTSQPTKVSSAHVPLPQHVQRGQEGTSGQRLSKAGPDGQGLWWSQRCLPHLQLRVPPKGTWTASVEL